MIERLSEEAEIERLQKELVTENRAWKKLLDEQQAEIERLQDEVQKAFEYGYNSGHMDSCMLAWKEYCGVKE